MHALRPIVRILRGVSAIIDQRACIMIKQNNCEEYMLLDEADWITNVAIALHSPIVAIDGPKRVP